MFLFSLYNFFLCLVCVFVPGKPGHADRSRFFPKVCAPCKESDGSHNALRVAVRCTRLTWEAATAATIRCERRYDFFEARITARFSAQKRRAFFKARVATK